MLKPCEIHKNRHFVSVSPYFAEAVGQGKKINRKERRYIKIETDGKIYTYNVDIEFFKKFFPDEKGDTVMLYDRDFERKQLNDRILIVKIDKEFRKVCPECLENIFYSDGE